MWWDDGDLQKLVGRTVSQAVLEVETGALLLATDQGDVRLVPYGDCCSHTWIESVDDMGALLGTIRSAERIAMPDLGDGPDADKGYDDKIAYYGIRITTEKGHAVIDFRNSSNGCYGGDLDVVLS